MAATFKLPGKSPAKLRPSTQVAASAGEYSDAERAFPPSPIKQAMSPCGTSRQLLPLAGPSRLPSRALAASQAASGMTLPGAPPTSRPRRGAESSAVADLG